MSKYISSIILGLFSITLIIIMSVFPSLVIESCISGLNLWINSVFPSLFPFLIAINIITHLGIVDFIGTLLTPIISPLFGISGIGAMPVVAGLTSGYPIGAKLTCQLYEEGRLSKKCASKVICFSNNSGPLFIVGSVGVGMFNNILIGYFILIVHIISAITLGILINIYSTNASFHYNKKNNILKASWLAMKNHIDKDKKTIGEILSLSVSSSISTIVGVGGYIILFSVVIQALKILQPNALLTNPLLESLLYGFIEMTNGVFIASNVGTKTSIILACMLISFGGFSIHAQAISFISKTDLSIFKYLLSKFICSLLALLYGFLIYPLFNIITTFPTFTQNANTHTYTNNYFVLISTVIFILFSLEKLVFHSKNSTVRKSK